MALNSYDVDVYANAANQTLTGIADIIRASQGTPEQRGLVPYYSGGALPPVVQGNSLIAGVSNLALGIGAVVGLLLLKVIFGGK